MNNQWTNRLLWTVYLALLGVLLPHTAWAFGQFEPAAQRWLGWVAALAFEGAIAAFTWRLKGVIEATPKHRSAWLRWRKRYLNIYSLGLAVAIAISAAANWAHSVEFGRPFAVFADYAIPPILYSVMLGGILPICSLLFARILADVQDTEHDQDPELAQTKALVVGLRRDLATAEQRAAQAEGAARWILEISAEDKARRILAVRDRWPGLSQSAIAIIAAASPAHVSEVLRAQEVTIEH